MKILALESEYPPPTKGLNAAPPNSAQTPIPYTDACKDPSNEILMPNIKPHNE